MCIIVYTLYYQIIFCCVYHVLSCVVSLWFVFVLVLRIYILLISYFFLAIHSYFSFLSVFPLLLSSPTTLSSYLPSFPPHPPPWYQPAPLVILETLDVPITPLLYNRIASYQHFFSIKILTFTFTTHTDTTRTNTYCSQHTVYSNHTETHEAQT